MHSRLTWRQVIPSQQIDPRPCARSIFTTIFIAALQKFMGEGSRHDRCKKRCESCKPSAYNRKFAAPGKNETVIGVIGVCPCLPVPAFPSLPSSGCPAFQLACRWRRFFWAWAVPPAGSIWRGAWSGWSGRYRWIAVSLDGCDLLIVFYRERWASSHARLSAHLDRK